MAILRSGCFRRARAGPRADDERADRRRGRVRRSRRREDAVPPRPRQGGGPARVGAARRLGLDDGRGPPDRAGGLPARRWAGRCLQRGVGEAGPLTRMEWEQVRMHAYYSERILAGSPSLRTGRAAGRHAPRAPGRLRVSPGLHGRCRPDAAPGSWPSLTPSRRCCSPDPTARRSRPSRRPTH